eukprot:s651_g10.t1
MLLGSFKLPVAKPATSTAPAGSGPIVAAKPQDRSCGTDGSCTAATTRSMGPILDIPPLRPFEAGGGPGAAAFLQLAKRLHAGHRSLHPVPPAMHYMQARVVSVRITPPVRVVKHPLFIPSAARTP